MKKAQIFIVALVMMALVDRTPAAQIDAIDPEAMIQRIVAVDQKQRDEIKDIVFDADYIEGKLNDDGVFEEKTRFVKKTYVKYLPDTALVYEDYLEYYKDGKLQEEKKRDKAADEQREKKQKRKGRDVSTFMMEPFYPDSRADYDITYEGVFENKIGGFICHHFRVRAKEEIEGLINGDFYIDAESFHPVRVDFSPAKMVKKAMFKMKELKLSMSYAPVGEEHWLPRQFDIRGKAKAMFFIGVTISGTEYFRNPIINGGIADEIFEVTDGK